MQSMKIAKIILAALVIWIVQMVTVMLTCGWLFKWVYEIPPIIWKDPVAMTSGLNMLGSNLVAIFGSIIFVLVYSLFYKGIPGKGVKKGVTYGFAVWLIGPLIGSIAMPFYMTISTAVIIYWVMQMFVLFLIKGAIVGAIYKEK